MAIAMGIHPPSWEDQIVPTLKKRLESESQYLSNRLSSSGFHEYEQHEIPPSPLSSHGGYGGTSGPISTSQPIRSRTKSTPFFDPAQTSSIPQEYQAGSSRIPIPSRPTQSSAVRRPAYNDTYDTLSHSQSPPSRIPRLQPVVSGPRRPSGSSLSSSTSASDSSPPILSSRTVTRPRSKTTLAPRPQVERSSSGSSQERQYPPSGLPIPIDRNRNQHKPRSTSISPARSQDAGSELEQSHYSGQGAEGNQEILAHRESFDLSQQVFQDTTNLRDELPPFRLAPEEAMRIASHGHRMDSDPEVNGPDEEEMREEEGMPKRKRVESMFPTKQTRAGGDGRTTGMSRSATGSALGIGNPSRMPAGGKQGSSHQPRSATGSGSSRTPLSSSQNSNTTRSMSLGHSLNIRSTSPIPTPPRMGVAAHFVPIESAYTPPKGANWDEVVLPALARKMGLGDKVGIDEMEEGDLAVEWDKNGTPVKWVKGRAARSEEDMSNPLNTSMGSGGGLGGQGWSSSARSGSAFSPSFEPSPDNPLHQSISNSHPRETSTESQPTPTPSPQRYQHPHQSNQTSDAYDDAYDIGPPSPALFSSLVSHPSAGGPGSGDVPRTGEEADGAISKKASFLRQESSVASRKASAAELRMASSRQGGMTGAQGQYRPGDGGGERQMAEGQARMGGVPVERSQVGGQRAKAASGQAPGKSRAKGKDEGEHSGGCGCVIM